MQSQLCEVINMNVKHVASGNLIELLISIKVNDVVNKHTLDNDKMAAEIIGELNERGR